MGGKKTADPFAKMMPQSISGIRLETLKKCWGCAKALFDYKKAEAGLRDLLPLSQDRLAFGIFFFGGLLVFVISLLTSLESIYLTNMEADTIGEVAGQMIAKVDLSIIPSIALYQVVLYIIFSFLLNLAGEGAAFTLFKASGGKGTLSQQMSLSSIVWLAVAMSLSVALIGPLYCLGFVALISMLVVSIMYLMAYMGARAYMIVHGVSFFHALIITLPLVIAKLAIWVVATNSLAAFFGLDFAGA